MKPNIRIVKASAAHIPSIARRMRQADRDEVYAYRALTPTGALISSLGQSASAWTAVVDGRPEVMFGVCDLNILTGSGVPWLLGTNAVDRHYVPFLRRSIEWRNQLLARYSTLRNFVDDRNVVSKRWLKWMGFTLHDPVMVNGHPFRLFEMRSSDV